MLAADKTPSEMAEELGVSLRATQLQLKQLRRKLGVENTHAVVARALQLRLVKVL